ncbi:Cytochrome c-type biogenesis protein CcmH [Azospirillaceae bacterium]
MSILLKSGGRFAAVILLSFGLLVEVCKLAGAVQPDEILPDPGMEARARVISQDLRCLVCQNQTIDDSNASLAHDLRLLVRERLKAGDDDHAVKAYITARYGDFVLLRPPFQSNTYILWGGPFVVLALGAFGLAMTLRRRRRRATLSPLSPEEQERLERLLVSGNTAD